MMSQAHTVKPSGEGREMWWEISHFWKSIFDETIYSDYAAVAAQ